MHLFIGIFLMAFTTLALEISLVRLLSVITWYHLAFFAISTAMLGMTAGAVTVYLRRRWFAGARLEPSVAVACLAYAAITPASLILLNLIPLGFEQTGINAMTVSAFVIATVACSLPFYCTGVGISALLTLSDISIGRLYAADLVGAAAGCLLVLAGLTLIDAPSFILLCAAIGGLAAYVIAKNHAPMTARLGAAAFLVIAAGAMVNAQGGGGIRPYMVKESIVDPESVMLDKWNSYSHIVVDKPFVGPPQYWGGSAVAPGDPIPQFWMRIDGSAGTTVRGFETLADIEHLRYDITNAGYYLRPTGGAAIIGVGGGRDLQSALLFGHDRVIGVDVNQIFIDLLNTEFAEFTGLATHPSVRLVADEARSYLSRTDEQFSIIQMSLVDTWAATGAGAFSFTENALYTIEGWRTFLGRLDDTGIYVVSRWHDPGNLGETGRSVSLAAATLLSLGVAEPSQHIAMLTNGNLSTLIVAKAPLSGIDIAALERLANELRYEIAILPGMTPANPDLAAITRAQSMSQLQANISGRSLNYSPPTDDSPYFFNMLKLTDLAAAMNAGSGVLSGNLTATLTLLALLAALAVLCVLTIILPLLIGKLTSRRLSAPSALLPAMTYFSLIGAGFMFTEIGLIQKLSVFLGHPVYALGILLFTIILTTGLGSRLSEAYRRTVGPPAILAVGGAAGIVAVQFLLMVLIDAMQASPMSARIAVSIVTISPLGLLLGFFFPLGMRFAKHADMPETAWLWALNGVFGVLASALAVFVAIYASISTNFYIGALCYLALLIPIRLLARQPAGTEEQAAWAEPALTT